MSSRCIVITVLLLGVAAFGAGSINAQSGSVWQATQTSSIPVVSRFLNSPFDPRGVQLTDEFLIMGIFDEANCGEVRIFKLDDLMSQDDAQPEWVLRPDGDDTASCNNYNRSQVFASRIAYADDILLVSDLDDRDSGSVTVYQAIRDDGVVIDWQVLAVLDSPGSFKFGTSIAIENKALLIASNDQNTSNDIASIEIYRLVNNELTLMNVFSTETNRGDAAFAGDQVLVRSAIWNIDNATLQEAKSLNSLEFPVSSANRVSGNRMITVETILPGLNVGNLQHKIHRRGQIDDWITTQTIDSPLPDMAFPSVLFSTSSALNGSDLLINWNGVDAGERINQLEYYQLDNSGEYVLQQQLLSNRQPFERQAAQVYLQGNRAVLLTSQTDSIDVQFFQRSEGNSFLIDRGISGNWSFGPSRNGQGMFVEVLGPAEHPRLLVHWDTHDNQGNQMWLRGVGDIDRDRVLINLREPLGGQFGPAFDPQMVQAADWGQIELIFTSCDVGILRYESPDFGQGEMALHRVYGIDGLGCGDALASDAASRWTGSWRDPLFDGQGFMLQVAQTKTEPVFAASWNTYDDLGNQVWLFANQRLDPPASGLLLQQVKQPVNMTFDGELDTSDRIIIDWGQYQLMRSDCNHIDLMYASLLPAFGSGQQSLQRITTPLGVACAD